jgi:primosomal protein N' (replication factor Y)
MTYVQVVVNVPSVAGVFDYAVPEGFQAVAGQLVTVPFGNQTVQGVILHFIDEPSVPEVKQLISALDPAPVISQAQIRLAGLLAAKSLAPIAAIIEMMLPPGLGQRADTRFDVRKETVQDGSRVSPLGSRLIKLLMERGPLRARQIDRQLGQVEWRGEARKLVRLGLLGSQPVLPASTVRPKFIRTAQLGVAPDVAEASMADLGQRASTLARRQAALRYLVRVPDAVNVAWVYAESGCNAGDLQELAERDLIVLRESEIWRDPLDRVEFVSGTPLKLNDDQKKAWNCIDDAFRDLAGGKEVKPFLLQGVTGSGKTELYLRAAEEAARRGRQAIILVPEIALTPQTVRRFLERFPGQVGLIHSKLSDGEKYDTWRRARAGLLKLVIGPRSALFSPLPNVGLVVVDECHDNSYYQAEPPFYHAASAAQAYARLADAVCILGSATPAIVQRYEAETGSIQYLGLPKRIAEAGLPLVSVVDMRQELKQGNRSMFSRELVEALGSALQKREQAILFLNRRGSATYVFCRDCGHVLKCPRCDTPLTLHLDGGAQLRCHHCGYERGRPARCPQCGSSQIREYGLGSERVEAEVTALFPAARTLRWDWETTRQKDGHEIILSHFSNHRADVLIGTQMLAKGLDLPMVTLVGIVLAEVGLNLPDPFAAERVFQVLTQVAGRAGRGERGGRAILQTFQPENSIIQSASHHDYAGFYERELDERKRLGYPPFVQLARLEIRHHEHERAEAETRQLAAKLQTWIEAEGRKQTTLIGPVPAFFSKLGGMYRWQIIVRGPDPASLLRGRVPPGVRLELEPVSLL